ncbi:MAG: hypothetical protein AAGG75_16340 [Bacteroidota bacterium]
MMSKKISLLCLSLLMILSACKKDSINETAPNTNVSPSANANFFQQAQQRNGTTTNADSTANEEDFECFSFVYPIDVLYPDGSTQTANSGEELENLIDQWFEQNGEDEENYPTLKFPLQVNLEDGSTQTINDEDTLCELFETCFDEEEEYDEEDEYDEEFDEICFDIVYPVTLSLPDGTTSAANNDEELEEIIFNWYEQNPDDTTGYPTFVYPIDVVLEDSMTQTLNSDEELEALLDACHEEFFEDCFSFNYPLTIVFPDATTAEASDDENLAMIVDQWYDANPSSEEEPDFSYPISVTLQEDGSTRTINNSEELDELFVDCYGEECEIHSGRVILGDERSSAAKVAVGQQQTSN